MQKNNKLELCWTTKGANPVFLSHLSWGHYGLLSSSAALWMRSSCWKRRLAVTQAFSVYLWHSLKPCRAFNVQSGQSRTNGLMSAVISDKKWHIQWPFSSVTPFDSRLNFSLMTLIRLFDSQSLFLPCSVGRMWVKSTSNLVWKACVCFYSYTSRCVPHFYSWPVKWVGGAVFRGCSEKCDTECLDASGIFAIWPTLGGRLPSVPKNIILSSKLHWDIIGLFKKQNKTCIKLDTI